MTETQQRFLRAIAERVPMAQVVELHLFPPIRQGGVETGVAVVAEDPRVASPNGAGAPDAISAGDTTQADAAPTADATSNGAEHASAVDTSSDAASEPVEAIASGDDADAGAGDDDVEARAGDEDDAESTAAPPARFTIHTARYRLTLKGVDRGKWEVDVVAEADAPLEALDKVVRGVQRRSGEGAEPDRLSTEAFRDALEAPLATLER